MVSHRRSPLRQQSSKQASQARQKAAKRKPRCTQPHILGQLVDFVVAVVDLQAQPLRLVLRPLGALLFGHGLARRALLHGFEAGGQWPSAKVRGWGAWEPGGCLHSYPSPHSSTVVHARGAGCNSSSRAAARHAPHAPAAAPPAGGTAPAPWPPAPRRACRPGAAATGGGGGEQQGSVSGCECQRHAPMG